MNTIKSFIAVMIFPVLLVAAFRVQVVHVSEVNRAPAVEETKPWKTVKGAVKEYVLAVNGIK